MRHSASKRLFSSLSLIGVIVLATAHPLRADLVSVAFNFPNQFGASPLVSGPEPAATAANPLFGAANVWNNLTATFGVVNTNPAWTSLTNSTGAATGVDFSITGSVLPVDVYPFVSNPDPLRSEFIAWNSNASASGPQESTLISWTLSGLAANSTFDMCVYGSRADQNRSFNMTIEGTTIDIPTFVSSDSHPADCALFANLTSNASGVISGVGTGIGSNIGSANEANWSGFQIVQLSANVPEPPSRLMLLMIVVFVGGLTLKKSLLV